MTKDAKIIFDHGVDIFEKQSQESIKRYNAFCVYRDLGPYRSIFAVTQNDTIRTPLRALKRWSVECRWVERAEAYDLYLEKQRRKTNEEQIKRMNTRHAQMSVAFQGKIADRLNTIDTNELQPLDLTRMLKLAVEIERDARGLEREGIRIDNSKTEHVKNHYDFSMLDAEEKAHITTLLGKVRNDVNDDEE